MEVSMTIRNLFGDNKPRHGDMIAIMWGLFITNLKMVKNYVEAELNFCNDNRVYSKLYSTRTLHPLSDAWSVGLMSHVPVRPELLAPVTRAPVSPTCTGRPPTASGWHRTPRRR